MFRDLFEIKHTEFILLACILPLPYIVISEICINFSLTNLVGRKFVLYRFLSCFVSMEISITLKTHLTQLESFSEKHLATL